METRNFKVTKDGFVWLIVHPIEAVDIFNNVGIDLYRLYDDDSEALIEDRGVIAEAYEMGHQIGIEVGFLKDIVPGNYINWEHRRFEAARSAMQGLLSMNDDSVMTPKSVARCAIACADELIDGLKKGGTA